MARILKKTILNGSPSRKPRGTWVVDFRLNNGIRRQVAVGTKMEAVLLLKSWKEGFDGENVPKE